MNVFNGDAYRECLNRARNDLVDAFDERYALFARVDGCGKKITQLRRRLRVRAAPDSTLRRRNFAGVPSVIEPDYAFLARLGTCDKKIAQLQAWIREIYADADESSQHRDVLCDDEDLKQAICTALRSAGRELTIPVILRLLKQLQFPIHHQQNPLSAVATTVKSLMAESKVVAGRPWGKEKTYELSPKSTSLLLRSLAGLNQVLRKKESKKHSQ